MDDLLQQKIRSSDYRAAIGRYAVAFSAAEQALLAEILRDFDFDAVQEQALVQAVLQQSRFNPDDGHWAGDDDEDVTGICPHCINPPAPPLRDYWQWRQKSAA